MSIPPHAEDVTILNYDDTPLTNLPVPPPTTKSSLLSRIGRSRVYALEEASPNLVGRVEKRKADILDDARADEDEDEVVMNADPTMRANAITLTGTPIEHLPTKKIFAYVAHYADFPPNALEWVNDSTVVIVYETNKKARKTFAALMRKEKSIPEDIEELTLAQKVPQELWPPQLRIDKLLGDGGGGSTGLSGDIQFRWASTSDVKKKGSSRTSGFYQRYGESAGKEGRPQWDHPGRQNKRGRPDGWSNPDDARWKHDRVQDDDGRDDSHSRRGGRTRPTMSDLDAELEAFANERHS